MEENENQKKKIIMKIDSVDYELKKDRKLFGTFSLVQSFDDYGFLWENSEESDGNEIPKIVFVPFSQISIILKRAFSFQKVSLRLIMVDSTRLDRFSFYKLPYIFVDHLLDYLSLNNIIQPTSEPNQYTIFHIDPYQDKDIYANPSLSNLTPEQATSMTIHQKILKSYLSQKTLPVISEQDLPKFQKMSIISYKSEIFRRGLDPSVRPSIWLHLLYPEININGDNMDKFFSSKFSQYHSLLETWNLRVPSQERYSQSMVDIAHVLWNDIARNDRSNPAFQKNNSPYLLLLSRVLTAYSLYNRDCGFVQGLCDLCTPFLLIYIKTWRHKSKNLSEINNQDPSPNNDSEKDQSNFANMEYLNYEGKVEELPFCKEVFQEYSEMIVEFFDGTEKSSEEAENIIFWIFVAVMEKTQQCRIFSELSDNQIIFLNCSKQLASTVHHPLKKRLSTMNCSFLFSSILLMFKRDFESSSVLRLWDSIFAHPNPYIFNRFITAAILIYIFPGLLLKVTIQEFDFSGEALNVTTGFLKHTNVDTILKIAYGLWDQYLNNTPLFDKTIFQDLHEYSEFRDYIPKYFNFCST